MKRLFALTLCLFVLAGCSGGERPYTTADATKLVEAGVFDGEMAIIESSVVPLLYGIEPDSLVEYISYQAVNTAVSADEVTVLVLKDEDSARRAEEACRARVESQIENCRLYSPGAIPNLEAAQISRVGSTVLMAVGDPQRLPAALRELRE